MGADAVLLIVAALSDAELAELPRPGGVRSGWTRWSRCTTRSSSHGPLAVGAPSIGVNQRDLVTFAVDTDRAVRARGARCRPARDRRGRVRHRRRPRPRPRCADAGYHAVLVGETLVRAG